MRGTRIGEPTGSWGGVMDVYARNGPKMNVSIPSTFATSHNTVSSVDYGTITA